MIAIITPSPFGTSPIKRQRATRGQVEGADG